MLVQSLNNSVRLTKAASKKLKSDDFLFDPIDKTKIQT